MKQSKSIANAKAKIRRSIGTQIIPINFKQGDFVPEFLTVGLGIYKIEGCHENGWYALYWWQDA